MRTIQGVSVSAGIDGNHLRNGHRRGLAFSLVSGKGIEQAFAEL